MRAETTASDPQRIGEENGKHAGELTEQRAREAGNNRQYISDADTIIAERPDLAEVHAIDRSPGRVEESGDRRHDRS